MAIVVTCVHVSKKVYTTNKCSMRHNEQQTYAGDPVIIYNMWALIMHINSSLYTD